jgi:hypothetical protein
VVKGTRRGYDRIKAQALSKAAADAKESVRTHRAACPKCKVDDQFPRHCCDDGWTLIKAGQYADTLLRSYLGTNQEGHDHMQGTLW